MNVKRFARGCDDEHMVAFSIKGSARYPGPVCSVAMCLGSFDCGVGGRSTPSTHWDRIAPELCPCVPRYKTNYC